MPDVVKVPGIGGLDKKKLMIGGLIGVALVVVVYIRKKGSAAASSAAPAGTGAAAGDQYPPDGSTGNPADPYSTDPSTGQTYGDEGQAGGYDASAGYDYGYAGTSPGYTGNGQIIGYDASGNPIYGVAGTQTSTPTMTETQWLSQASADLASFAGIDQATAGMALTLWLAGQPLTPQQAQYVREALAIDGNPPNGAPPIIPASGGTGGKAHNPVSGLHATPGFTSVELTWAASQGATDYLVTASGPGAPPGQKVTGTSARIGNLRSKTSYDVRVRAQPGGMGGTDAHVTVKTK